jgi:predicted nucleotidyltransferase
MKPTDKILKRLTKTIVTLVHPTRIILFGSAARGKMGKHSDLDILVVMRNGIHRRRTTDKIYLGSWDFNFAMDIIVVTEKDVAQYGANPYMIIHSAMKEGRELYHAA